MKYVIYFFVVLAVLAGCGKSDKDDKGSKEKKTQSATSASPMIISFKSESGSLVFKLPSTWKKIPPKGQHEIQIEGPKKESITVALHNRVRDAKSAMERTISEFRGFAGFKVLSHNQSSVSGYPSENIVFQIQGKSDKPAEITYGFFTMIGRDAFALLISGSEDMVTKKLVKQVVSSLTYLKKPKKEISNKAKPKEFPENGLSLISRWLKNGTPVLSSKVIMNTEKALTQIKSIPGHKNLPIWEINLKNREIKAEVLKACMENDFDNIEQFLQRYKDVTTGKELLMIFNEAPDEAFQDQGFQEMVKGMCSQTSLTEKDFRVIYDNWETVYFLK